MPYQPPPESGDHSFITFLIGVFVAGISVILGLFKWFVPRNEAKILMKTFNDHMADDTMKLNAIHERQQIVLDDISEIKQGVAEMRGYLRGQKD